MFEYDVGVKMMGYGGTHIWLHKRNRERDKDRHLPIIYKQNKKFEN